MSFYQIVMAITLEICVDVTNQGVLAAYGEFVQNLRDTPVSLILDSAFDRSSPESIAHPAANGA